jgi:hypothetical protein
MFPINRAIPIGGKETCPIQSGLNPNPKNDS